MNVTAIFQGLSADRLAGLLPRVLKPSDFLLEENMPADVAEFGAVGQQLEDASITEAVVAAL